MCSPSYIGTCNRRVKFGLKILNRLGKVSENFRGIFLTHTVYKWLCVNAVSELMRVGDVTPVAAALLYHPAVQHHQQQQRMRTCSFSSTGSGSTGSAATPPLSPPRPGAFFPPATVASKPQPPASKPEVPSTGSSSGTPTGSAQTPPPPSSTAVQSPARGNIFEHRADLAAFKAIRRAAQNAYHIRLDDDGPHGNDDVRRLLMRRLSAAGVRRFACVACRRSLPVYDEFPLVDGTFFLSPRHYGTTALVYLLLMDWRDHNYNKTFNKTYNKT